MGTDGNKNLSGLPMYHLRRIGPRASIDGVVNVMDFYRVTYIIGRSEVRVDFYIDSSNHIQSASLSRCHARVVRQNGNQHRLYDDSLNGVFINNIKIAGSCVLREGDKVTFGHPCGARLPAGSRSRQPDSHHQFMFESCACEQLEQNGNGATGNKIMETNGFKKPVSPVEGSGCNLARKSKRAARKATQCFSTEDVRQLKQAWEEKQNSSTSDISDVEDTSVEACGTQKENEAGKSTSDTVTDPGQLAMQRNREVGNAVSRVKQNGDRSQKEALKKKWTQSALDTADIDDTAYEAGSEQEENEADETVPLHLLDAGKSAVQENGKFGNVDTELVDKPEAGRSDCGGLLTKNTKNSVVKSLNEKDSGTKMNKTANCVVEQCCDNTVEETLGTVINDESDVVSLEDMVVDDDKQDIKEKGADMSSSANCDSVCDNFTALEGTVNSIIKDLCDMRGKVENAVENSELQISVIPVKSPTKDACIQTTQSETTVGGNYSEFANFSPTKEMGIQTSQVMVFETMESHTEGKEVASGTDNSAGTDDVASYAPPDSFKNTEYRKVSETENDKSSEAGHLSEMSEKIDKETNPVELNEKFSKESCSSETCDETFETCIGPASEDMNLKDIESRDRAVEIMSDTFHTCIESPKEGSENVMNSTLNTNEDSDIENLGTTTDLESRDKAVEILSDTFHTCIESHKEGSENEMNSTLNIDEDSDIENLGTTTDLESRDKAVEILSDTFYTCIESPKEGSENEMNSTLNANEDSDIENLGTTTEDQCPVAEIDTVVKSSDVVYSASHVKEFSEGEGSNESSECVLIRSKGQNKFVENEVEMTVDAVYRDAVTQKPVLILSDSIEYEEEEENIISDLLLSNSIEYSDDESDRNISDSENDEIDNVVDGSVTADESDENKDNQMVVDQISPGIELKSDSDYAVCAEILNNSSENRKQDKISEYENDKAENTTCNEVVDKVTVHQSEITDRKRKVAEEENSDSLRSRQRKTHCSDTMNVINGDNREQQHEHDDRNSNYSSGSDDESLSSSQIGLQKLKKGVKRFFKFWTKKSYNMNKNEANEAGYLYLQDKTGDYKLLEIDCPPKKYVVECKDGKKTGIGHEKLQNGPFQNELRVTDVGCCSNSTDSDLEQTDYIHKSRSDEKVTSDLDNNVDEKIVPRAKEVIEMETEAFEKGDESKNEERCKEIVEETENMSFEAESEIEDSVLEENSNADNDTENLEKDIVETSMCQTDSEIDSNYMIKSSILASAFRTPSKHLCNMSSDQSSPMASPVLKLQNNEAMLSQSQSPVIAKQEVKTTSKVAAKKIKSSVTQLFGKESGKEASSQLSCRFSDDDDDFYSPEIDFGNLDDSGEEIIEDTEDDIERDVSVSKFENNTNVVKSKYEKKSGIGTEKLDTVIKNLENFGDEENLDIKEIDTVNIVNEGKAVQFNEKSSDDVDDSTSDPLESYINHETEDDGDIESVSNESDNENASIMDDIDFDFCDSESEKENIELPDSDKNEEIVLDDEEDDTEVVEEGSDSKQTFKRKSVSDSDDRSPKKHKELVNDSTLQKENYSTFTPFKTPMSMSKNKQSRTPDSCQSSRDQYSSTQLMDASQTQDLDALTMTQVTKVTEQLEVKASDNSRSKASRNKAKDLLEKLKAKRRVKEEALDEFPSSSPTPGSSQSMEIEIYSRTRSRERTQAQVVLEDVNKHVNNCRTVIDKMKSMFDNCTSLQGNPRVTAWRGDLVDIEKKLQFPKTVIAVVGDTGAGKSSLMNAILDHRSVLPTSGIRACTAVVVEVVNNTTSSNFEADIQFLQRQEWMEELQVLLKDLTGLDGKVKNRPPDPTSDAFVSYCKVRAVYGRIDRFEVLSRLTTVTHWLGRVKVIRSTKPGDFRRQVEKYIETQEPGDGGQYWPIVKHVRLKMPNCDVCSSGASLVDLPGVRDSNAARDKIAKEYLKNCTAVWVVSSIHRAIDDKTAKDLLGENFRRQLLMDGQYGSIAFICTKTDVLMPSEIIRPLKLEDQTKEHEDQVAEMESEKSELDLKVSSGTKEMRKLKKTVASLKTEAKELRDNLTELGNLIDLTDLDSSQSEEKEAIEEYEKELKEKVEELNEAENRMDELHDEKHEATQKILELEKKKNESQKVIAAICARARNEYSKSQIKRDFKAGLKEMRRRAGMLNDDDDEEEDIYSDDDDDDVGSSAENLKVFCCSSTEYQKMKKLLTDDGPPQVFSSVEDTQIPALRHYVHEMTSVRRKQWLERLVRNVGRFVFDLQMYVSERGDMKSRDRSFAKSAIDIELQKFDTSLAPVLQHLTSDIDSVFDGSIRQKMEEGATSAASEASSTCAKWSAPVNRDKTKDKKSGGLHWATYRAAVRRQGVFTSHSYGPVDFNEDLAEPMYRSMTIVWDKAFSGMLWRILDKLKLEILSRLKTFITDLKPRLEKLGVQPIKTERVSALLLSSASNKLSEMVAYLKDTITNKQRDISRIITPHVQSSLLPEYNTGAAECGPGMYNRIKACMSSGIDTKRFTMFDEATQQLMHCLMELQAEIMQYVRQVCQSLIQDLRTAFEPLWEAPSNTSIIRSAFQKTITEACSMMHNIYDEAGLSHTEERAVIPAVTSTQSLSSIATVSSCPAGSHQTIASSHEGSDWQTFENTFQRKQDTNYGTVEQSGRVGVRVKTETLSQSCLSETTETVSRVQTLHIKQEKHENTFDEVEQKPSIIDQSVMNFGRQTLQDLQCGKLEVSPVEVTVQTAPVPTTSTRTPNIIISTGSQQNAVRYSYPGTVVTGNSKQPGLGTVRYLSVPASVGQSSQATGSLPQYGLMQTLPDGCNVIQPFGIKSLVTGEKILRPNVEGTVTSTHVPSGSISAPVPNTNLLHKAADQPRGSQVTQTQNMHAKCSTGRVQQATLVTASQKKPAHTPFLNMVVGKENVSSNSATGSSSRLISASQPSVNNSHHNKGKKKLGRSQLSFSQKNTPAVTTAPPPVIKTEPVDRGIYGRVKYLGSIDLTDD